MLWLWLWLGCDCAVAVLWLCCGCAVSVPVQLANWPGIPETEAQWQDNFKDRLIISGFMKDGTLGDRTVTAQSQHSHSTVTAHGHRTR